MEKLGKKLVLAGALAMTVMGGAMAQSPGNTRVSVSETRICNPKEIDDYKHSHFNQSTRDRGDERISLRRNSESINHNYKQQAGAPADPISVDHRAKEKAVPDDDQVVRERNYKQKDFS